MQRFGRRDEHTVQPLLSPKAHGWTGLYEEDPERDMLFSAVVHELQNIGILAAVTCSTVNDLYRNGASSLPAHCHTLMPPEPITLPLLAGSQRVWRLGPRLVPQIDTLMFYLTSARRLMMAKQTNSGVAATLSNVEFDELVDAWRAVTDAIWNTFDVIECEPPVKVTAELSTSIQKLKGLLVRARDGETPCLADGRVKLPDWAQRRHRQRVVQNVRATALYNGRFRTILVRDVSYGGLGIDFAPGLQSGDGVTVTLETGRRFETVVAWANGNRAGLKFYEELAIDDPLVVVV